MIRKISLVLCVFGLFTAAQAQTGDEETPRPANQTMKQLVRGTEYAVASMMPQASLIALIIPCSMPLWTILT